MINHPQKPLLLVTGATGYIGGRLIPRLLEAGYPVRVMTRGGRARLAGRPWAEQVEVAEADVLKPDTLSEALDGVQVAYYLIHSMQGGDEFHQRDLDAARNFAQTATECGVERIVYLGGLGDPTDDLSKHLRSRQETGQALRDHGNVPITEFRAAAVIGSGSLSFEMLRYLTERLPFMLMPKWVETKLQPIAIRDILAYFIAALDQPESAGQIIEIGGDDVLSYREMMAGYAEVRDLKRGMIPVPFFTPRLSSYWVHLVTPVPANIAQPLIDGMHNKLVVRHSLAQQLFPDIKPLDYRTALELALERVASGHVESIWSDALVDLDETKVEQDVVFTAHQGMNIERRERIIEAEPEHVYTSFTRIGGRNGWFRYNILWQLRGWFDRIIGGVGMRSRYVYNHPQPVPGQMLDFWRVEKIEPDRLIRLRAEMKLPGEGWLQFEATPCEDGRTKLVQTAFFAPRGLFGALYWFVLVPFHGLIFGNMAHEVARRAEALSQGRELEDVLEERKRMTRRNGYALPVAVGLPLAVGSLSSVAVASSLQNWYRRLEKPVWTPPDWLFGPVWTFLYVTMGIASWSVWIRRVKNKEAVYNALSWYGVQLAANTLWSVVFFGLRRIDWGLVNIMTLWTTLLATIFKFNKVWRGAAILMIPYFLWVTFATALNAAIWWLNRPK